MITAHHFIPNPSKTYATRENAVKAVQKIYGPNEPHFGSATIHYVIMQGNDGRWFPVFVGERALQAGAHFHFAVLA